MINQNLKDKLKYKRKSDFDDFYSDVETSFSNTIAFHKNQKDGYDIFKPTYSLFVLIEMLCEPAYINDPTKEILLHEAILEGDKKLIARTYRNLTVADFGKKGQLIKKGLLKKQFTPYLQELYSDVIMLLNNYYLNNYRGCYISLRSVLEDLYRHFYYSDHLPEFLAVTKDDISEYSIGLVPEFFRKYLSEISGLKYLSQYNEKLAPKQGKEGDVFGWNNDLYKKTSAYVHASKPVYMSGFARNSDMQFEQKQSNRLIDLVRQVMKLSIILLISFHKKHFIQVNNYIKSLVLEVFEKEIKRNLRQCLNV
jgi:hypothetical protein